MKNNKIKSSLLEILPDKNSSAHGITVDELVMMSGRSEQAVRRFLLTERKTGRVVCEMPKWYERTDGKDGRTRLYWRFKNEATN